MPTSYSALCHDFLVEAKLGVKMPLPSERETVLHFFDRVRKTMPAMDHFATSGDEFTLESTRHRDRDSAFRWLNMREKELRCGYVNPDTLDQAMALHRLLTDVAPHFLTLTAIDIDSLELSFGFDLEAEGDHDDIIRAALFDGSPLGEAMAIPGARALSLQPMVAMTLNQEGTLQAEFEIKTRHKTRTGVGGHPDEPLSLFVNVRRIGPFGDLEEVKSTLPQLLHYAEHLANDRLLPHLLKPISAQISNFNQ